MSENQVVKYDRVSASLMKMGGGVIPLPQGAFELMVGCGMDERAIQSVTLSCLACGVNPALLAHRENLSAVKQVSERIRLKMLPKKHFNVIAYETDVPVYDGSGNKTGEKKRVPQLTVIDTVDYMMYCVKEDARQSGVLLSVVPREVTDIGEKRALFSRSFPTAIPMKDAVLEKVSVSVASVKMYTKTGVLIESGQEFAGWYPESPWKVSDSQNGEKKLNSGETAMTRASRRSVRTAIRESRIPMYAVRQDAQEFEMELVGAAYDRVDGVVDVLSEEALIPSHQAEREVNGASIPIERPVVLEPDGDILMAASEISHRPVQHVDANFTITDPAETKEVKTEHEVVEVVDLDKELLQVPTAPAMFKFILQSGLAKDNAEAATVLNDAIALSDSSRDIVGIRRAIKEKLRERNTAPQS